MPDTPGWASERVIVNLWRAAIAGLIALGTAFRVQFVLVMNKQAFGLLEATLIAAVLSACYLIVRTMVPRRRLAQYAGDLARTSNASESSVKKVVALTPADANDHSASAPSLTKAT